MDRLTIALTGGQSTLGHALTAALRQSHLVVEPDGDIRDERVTGRLVAGADAVVHLAPVALPVSASARETLDYAARGTYVVLNAALEAGIRRVVLGSTLGLMERYPHSWRVSESWRPRPDPTELDQLSAYLAEESSRQISRLRHDLSVICLRLGCATEDAVSAIQQALTASSQLGLGWRPFHIPSASPNARFPLAAAGLSVEDGGLGYRPQHPLDQTDGAVTPQTRELAGDLSLLGPRDHIPSRPIRKVVVFGAAGPLAAATARALADTFTLRLTDLRPLEDLAAEGKPQSPGAPLPVVLGPPHETRTVDVTDPDQVLDACEGMDAIVNCSVIRPHPVNAFLVNLAGAYNVARAAVRHKIRRAVHTGPQILTNVLTGDRPGGHWFDFDLPDDTPARPGAWLYGHTKYLGFEVLRLFAEHYDLEVPTLLFSIFVNPQVTTPQPIDANMLTKAWAGMHPMTVSWEDAGRAVRRAVEVPFLPRPFELFHILADLPHGTYTNEKAKRLLGWRPRDTLSHLWVDAERH